MMNPGEKMDYAAGDRDVQRRIMDLARFPEENPFPVLRISQDGTILYSNGPGRRVLEFWSRSVGESAPAEWCELVRGVLNAGQMRVEESPILERTFSFVLAPVADTRYVNIYGQDITVRKRVEEELRERQMDLNRAQAVAHTGSWRLNVRRNELSWSDEAYRIFGVPPGTPLTYESFLGFVHPDDRDFVDKKWQAALSGEHYDTEHRIIVAGSVKWVRERAELEFDKDSTLLGGFGTVTDITERKKMEDALRLARDELEIRVRERTAELDEAVVELQRQVRHRIEAEEAVKAERQRLNDVLETLPVYVVLLTEDYHVPFANRFFEERFGKSNGKRCYEYLFNRREPCEICETYTVLKTNKPHHWEWTGPDGRNYDIYDYPFADTDGSRLVMEMGIDITELKRAGKALRSSEERYRSLTVATTQIVWTTNAQGEVTGDLPSWRAFTGQSVQEIKGWGWADALHPDDRENTRAVWLHSVKTRSLYETEYRIRRHDGKYCYVAARGVPVLEEDGSIREWVGTCTDITERREAEIRDRITNVLLELFAQKTSRKEYLDSVVEAIRDWSGCRCIGIRLANAEGYIPYESWTGFSDEFLSLESMLCVRKDVCACIRVVTQAPEPQDASVMTPRGSFRCDNTFGFIDTLAEREKARFRGNCIRSGFASVAVVPIRYREKVLGAIHLADERDNKVPLETVQFLESMAMLVGEAVHRFDIETALRQSEERYRQLVEVAPDGIGVERDDRIVFINNSGAKLLGSDRPEDLIGKPIFDFVHPDFRKRTQRQLEYLRRKGKTLPLREDRFVRIDGTFLDAEVTATPLIYQNKWATQIVFRDITERKRAQERILADQKQLRSLTADLVLVEERERHEIATAMHDSIGPILAFAKRELGVLQKTAPKKIAGSLKEVALNIGQAVHQTRNLTFDLSPPTLYTLGFDIAIEELTERFCKEHKLEYRFKGSEETKPLSDHVKVLLYRSVREILINIAKHAEARLVRVALARVSDEIQVAVEDDGRGFDLAVLDGKPRGLGLFSIRERLMHIGGKLEIESAPGKGTRVTLLAPLKLQEKPKEEI